MTYPRLALLLARRPLIANNSPEHIMLSPSSVCNLNCKMCPNSYKVSNKKVLAFADFKRILESTKVKRLTLVGTGETFVNPDIIDILYYAKQRCNWVSSTSNFTLVENVIGDIIKSKLDVMKISIDGATKETYNKIRKGAQFETVVENIKALVKTKKELHSENPFIRFNFVIQHDNYSEIDAMIELANDLGLTNVLFTMVRTCQEKLLDIPKKSLMEKIIKGIALAKKFRIYSNLEAILADLQSYSFESYMDYCRVVNGNGHSKFYGCVYPWLSAQINVEGYVLPCCSYHITSEEDYFGNVLESKWKDIWNGQRFQQLRFQIKRKGEIPFSCKQCNGISRKSLLRIDKWLPRFT